jgi:hypothetical protein
MSHRGRGAPTRRPQRKSECLGSVNSVSELGALGDKKHSTHQRGIFRLAARFFALPAGFCGYGSFESALERSERTDRRKEAQTAQKTKRAPGPAVPFLAPSLIPTAETLFCCEQTPPNDRTGRSARVGRIRGRPSRSSRPFCSISEAASPRRLFAATGFRFPAERCPSCSRARGSREKISVH